MNVAQNIQSSICAQKTLPDWSPLYDFIAGSENSSSDENARRFLNPENSTVEKFFFFNLFMSSREEKPFHIFIYARPKGNTFEFIKLEESLGFYTWHNSTKPNNQDQTNDLVYIGSQDESQLQPLKSATGVFISDESAASESHPYNFCSLALIFVVFNLLTQ